MKTPWKSAKNTQSFPPNRFKSCRLAPFWGWAACLLLHNTIDRLICQDTLSTNRLYFVHCVQVLITVLFPTVRGGCACLGRLAGQGTATRRGYRGRAWAAGCPILQISKKKGHFQKSKNKKGGFENCRKNKKAAYDGLLVSCFGGFLSAFRLVRWLAASTTERLFYLSEKMSVKALDKYNILV